MADDLRARADERFERALRETGARDPRNFFRDQLRDLRARDGEAFQQALTYFNQRLIPAVADDASDPIAEWLEYGARLVFVVNPRRRTVAVHRPDRPLRVLTVEGTLDGEEVVPGWTLPLRELFGEASGAP